MILALLVFLSTAFPSTSRTSWMAPESFHLTIGMNREAAVRQLRQDGWTAKSGKNKNQLIVDYTGDKALTLDFQKGRLTSIRFELFAFLPEARAAFDEQRTELLKRHGLPRRGTSAIVLYDDRLPNILVVLSADPKSEHGRRGIGFLAVRYYDPTV